MIDEQTNAASFEVVLGTGDYYGLTKVETRRIVKETVAAVSSWRKEATKLGCSRREIDRMATAFEHEAQDAAREYVGNAKRK
jgi:serine/threonine-protein kinase HipA